MLLVQFRRPQFNSWVGKICWRRDSLPTPVILGFPCGSVGKESICNVGDLGLIPGLGRSPAEGKGYPLQYSGLENSIDCIVHGVAKSRTWQKLNWTDFYLWASLVAQMVKNLPAMQETWVQSLGWEGTLGRAWQPTPVFLPGKSPGTEEPGGGGLQSMGSQRVGHDWATKHSTVICRKESFILRFFSFFNFYVCIYFWLCWVFLPLVVVSRNYSLVVACGFLIAVASLVSEPWVLGCVVLSSCGTFGAWVSLFRGTWNSPRPGTNPCPLHWQGFPPLSHQGSPSDFLPKSNLYFSSFEFCKSYTFCNGKSINIVYYRYIDF